MLAYKTKLVKIIIFASLFFMISYIKLLEFSYAEDKALKEHFDYSNLSDEDRKEEAELIYKYAKKSYMNNDIETAKTLFYKVLELEPDHIGANRYIEYIIPRKLSVGKYTKVKEAKIILDKKEELEFKNLDKTIEEARKKTEELEKERLTRETLYKSNLNKLEKNKKIEAENKKRKESREKAEIRKQARLKKQKKIKEAKELQGQKQKSVAKVKDIKKETNTFKDNKEITKEDIKAIEGIEERTEEKLIKEIDKKEGVSWKMMEKELDSLQKENKRLMAKKERSRRKQESKELKEKNNEKKRQYRLQKVEQNKNKILDKKKEIEERKKKVAEENLDSPAYKAKEEREKIAQKKAEEKALEKAMLRQQKLKQKEKSQVDNKKDYPQEIQQNKKILGNVAKKDVFVVSDEYKKKLESALAKQDKESQIKALYKEGMYYYKSKDYDLAREFFSKIIEIDPHHVKALDYLYIYIPEAQSNR